jgi:flagellar biosynthesis protein FlhA|tara:strand:- start:2104 stop:4185 length:2082 start_codon:yes stop_codon:yes gene_type:complete
MMARLFQPTVLLALALMAVIVMMILPVPAFVLDIGLAMSFALAILVFTVTLFIERPLDFSAFPMVLLASLMLRLSLNVSSTKLIIGQGHKGTHAAGNVIEGFANFIMSGSVLIGLVVFLVLLIVNFIVITKGATRMAEVGARFALDGMPGKQLAIDSDMAAGAIDHDEAKRRRERDQAETTFFGSLDGASKFVKGDAVAGLLITLLNIIMGLIIGIALHGMPIGQAFNTYAILTVGDGLVSQIPSVIISIASALLLAKGGTSGAMNLALFGQLGRYPAALGTVAALLGLFGLVPGLPFVPFFGGALILGTAAFLIDRNNRAQADAAAQAPKTIEKPEEKPVTIGDMLDLDDIHVEFASDLVSMVLDPINGLDSRIGNMRRHVAETYGLILPEMRLTDGGALTPGEYSIRIQGVEHARNTVRPDRVLALHGDGSVPLPPGDDVNEPVYGAPARWVSASMRDELSIKGVVVVNPSEVLATHLLEILRSNFDRLMTLKSLRRILEELKSLSDTTRAEANRKLLDELIPDRVPIDILLAVLRLLLEEQVSIRNLPLILEAMAEARHLHQNPEALTEYVRQRMGLQIIADYRRTDGSIPLVQLAPDWEKTFVEYQIEGPNGGAEIALPPEVFNKLAQNVSDKLNQATEQGSNPAIVTSSLRRRYVRMVLAAKGIMAPVFSYEEIGTRARPTLVGLVPV